MMANYSRALTQRNNLLRSIREGAAAPDELRFWDSVIVDDGSQIVDWRKEAMAALTGPLASAHSEIAPTSPRSSSLTCPRTPACWTRRPATRSAGDLAETAEKEQWNGQTLVGPHRDDVAFVSASRDLSGFASRRSATHGDPGFQAGHARRCCGIRSAGRRSCCLTTCSASSIRSAGRTSSVE